MALSVVTTRSGERRDQVRVPVDMPTSRARRWFAGAWRDLVATVVDLSSRGVGLRVDQAVKTGDRLSLLIPLDDGQPELRITIEVRHVRAEGDQWLAGGLFRTLAPGDHERVVRFVFSELGKAQDL